jgi:hypothetical protein
MKRFSWSSQRFAWSHRSDPARPWKTRPTVLHATSPQYDLLHVCLSDLLWKLPFSDFTIPVLYLGYLFTVHRIEYLFVASFVDWLKCNTTKLSKDAAHGNEMKAERMDSEAQPRNTRKFHHSQKPGISRCSRIRWRIFLIPPWRGDLTDLLYIRRCPEEWDWPQVVTKWTGKSSPGSTILQDMTRQKW